MISGKKKKSCFGSSTGANKKRCTAKERVAHPGCVLYIKRSMWFVSRSSLEATASKPAHPRRSNPPQAAVPICLASPSSSPFDKAAARSHQSSVRTCIYVCVCACVCVCVKQKEKIGATLHIHHRTIFFPLPLPLERAAVAASRLTGCRSWHDMFPQQSAAPSSPPLDQIKPVGWCTVIGALVLSNSPESEPDAHCCLYHCLIHQNNPSSASYPGMCIYQDESHFCSLQCSFTDAAIPSLLQVRVLRSKPYKHVVSRKVAQVLKERYADTLLLLLCIHI